MRRDVTRRHRVAGASERVENGPAELPTREMRRGLAPQLRSDRPRRQRRIEDAKRAIDAFEIGAELNDALLGLAQLAVEFGALVAERGDHMRFGHSPWNAGPGQLDRLWYLRRDTAKTGSGSRSLWASRGPAVDRDLPILPRWIRGSAAVNSTLRNKATCRTLCLQFAPVEPTSASSRSGGLGTCRKRPGLLQLADFRVGEKARSDNEPLAVRGLEGEAVAAARRHVDGELAVGPIIELRGADVKRTVLYRTEQNVLGAERLPRPPAPPERPVNALFGGPIRAFNAAWPRASSGVRSAAVRAATARPLAAAVARSPCGGAVDDGTHRRPPSARFCFPPEFVEARRDHVDRFAKARPDRRLVKEAG